MKYFKRFEYSHENIEEVPLDEQSMTDNMRDKTYYIEDFDEIVDLCNRLWLDHLNIKGVLHDFMDMMNRIQFCAQKGYYYELDVLCCQARDMLENMGIEIDKND